MLFDIFWFSLMFYIGWGLGEISRFRVKIHRLSIEKSKLEIYYKLPGLLVMFLLIAQPIKMEAWLSKEDIALLS